MTYLFGLHDSSHYTGLLVILLKEPPHLGDQNSLRDFSEAPSYSGAWRGDGTTGREAMEGGRRAGPTAALHKAPVPQGPHSLPHSSHPVSPFQRPRSLPRSLPNPAQAVPHLRCPPSFPLRTGSCLRAFPDHPSPEGQRGGRAWPQGPNYWCCHLPLELR